MRAGSAVAQTIPSHTYSALRVPSGTALTLRGEAVIDRLRRTV